MFLGGSFTFDKPIYISLIVASLILLIVTFYSMKNLSVIKFKDLIVWVWIIPLTFVISAFWGVSKYFSLYSVYLQIFYAILFVAGVLIAQNLKYLKIVELTLYVSGYFIVIHGFLNWFGNVNYTDAIFGYRLAGVFQYPNAYAAFLIGLFFITINQIIKLKEWKKYISYSLMLVPVMLSMLFTLSRGGVLLFLVVLFVYMCLVGWKKQINLLAILLITGIASIAISTILFNARTPSTNGGQVGWALLIFTSMIVACAVWFIKEKISCLKITENQRPTYRNFILPVSLIAFAFIAGYVALLIDKAAPFIPSHLRRIFAFDFAQAAFSDRFVFFSDALSVIAKRPFFGFGGGGWAAVYEKYRSFPYTSNQVHNFIIQYVIEVGLIGGIVLLAFIGWIVFKYLKKHYQTDLSETSSFTFLIVAMALLIHSLVDFTLSFAYLAAIVFLSLGIMWSSVHISEVAKRTVKEIRANKNAFIWKSAYISLMAIVAIALLVTSSRSLQANSKYETAMDKLYGKNEIGTELYSAVRMHPGNPEYALLKVNIERQLYNQNHDASLIPQTRETLLNLEKTEPYNKMLYNEYIQFLIQINELEPALELIRKREADFPWYQEQYELYLKLLLTVGSRSENKGIYWSEAEKLYSELKTKESIVKNENVTVQNGGFGINPSMSLTMSQIYLWQGKYKQVSDTTGVLVMQDFTIPYNVEVARVYVVAMLLQNREQEITDLYNKLTNDVQGIKESIDRTVAEVKNEQNT